jgi:hypothetical protein
MRHETFSFPVGLRLQPAGFVTRPINMKQLHTKRLAFGLCILLFSSLLAAQAPAPERLVKGNRLISKSDPEVTIKLPRNAKHLGADRWNLYDIADCELHVFVEADANKLVRTLYWIQFEGYLPTNTHIYDYSKDEPVTFAGRQFYQRPRFGPNTSPAKPGSDLEHVRAIVERAGYRMPAESMNVRLVHLLDEARRKELMFIYIEDLAPTGYTSEQLMDGDNTRPEWEPIKKELVARAMKRIELSPP